MKKYIIFVLAIMCLSLCVFNLGTHAYFADVNQYNDLLGEEQTNDPTPSPQPRSVSVQNGISAEPLTVAIAVILAIIGGAAALAVLLGAVTRVRRDK